MRKLLSKVMVLMLAGILSIVFFTACGTNDSAQEDDDYVFRIGTADGMLCLAPLHVAEDLGYFEEEFEAAGIKYELVDTEGQLASELIASDKIDGSVSLASAMIPKIDSGLEIAFTGGIHTGCTKYYVKADSDIASLEDLKGKKIGVPGITDSSTIAIKRKLYDLGIGVSTTNMEIELIEYNLTDLPMALENGAVDVIAVHDPVATLAEQEYDFRKILDLTEDEKFANEYCCQIFVSTDVAENHPEAAAAYTRALLKASAYVEADPESAAELQIENNQCSGELESNIAMLSSYNYTPSVSLAEQTFRNAVTELISIGDLEDSIDVDEFTEQHFAIFDGVPDSYIYNEDGTFTEVN